MHFHHAKGRTGACVHPKRKAGKEQKFLSGCESLNLKKD